MILFAITITNQQELWLVEQLDKQTEAPGRALSLQFIGVQLFHRFSPLLTKSIVKIYRVKLKTSYMREHISIQQETLLMHSPGTSENDHPTFLTTKKEAELQALQFATGDDLDYNQDG